MRTSTIASVVRRRAQAPIGTVQWIEVESAGRRILFYAPTTAEALRAAFGGEW